MVSRPFSRKHFLASLLALVALPAAIALAAPPLLVGVGVDFTAISPNGDRLQDEVRFFYTLAGDTARVSVLVHQDAAGAPGAVVDTLRWDEPRPLGPDTLLWAGTNTAGARVADGTYWIRARALNVDGAAAESLSLVVDTVAPRDTLTAPARTFSQGLVHQVAGRAWDANGLAHLVLTLSSEGRSLVDTLCAPCPTDTTSFDVAVPDSIAATDSLRITIDAVDPAGNGRPRVTLVVIDSLPPPAPVIDPIASPIDRDSVVVRGTASEAESVFVSLDGTVVARVRVLSGSRFEARLRGFAEGTHTVVAQSQDRALNLSPQSAPGTFIYREVPGIVVPERFVAGEYLQVNLSKPGSSVRVRVYDLTGRLVKRFEDRAVKTVYEFSWDLRDEKGNPVGSGPYVVGVEAEHTDGTHLLRRMAMVVTR